jgi:hypothetical protein
MKVLHQTIMLEPFPQRSVFLGASASLRLCVEIPSTSFRLRAFSIACKKYGILPTRFLLLVNIASQSISLFEKCSGRKDHGPRSRFEPRRTFRCSTSRFGIGQIAGSNCTPLGLHRIAEKIGGGWPVGAVFRSRKIAGFTWKSLPWAPITSRILWLDGLEPGFNRGGNVDSHARYIYIHGTGDEPTLGQPASHGCIHLTAQDLLPLFDKLPLGTLVWIAR